jgi:hypothetical protein
MVFAHLRQTLLMPGEMAAHEDIGGLADARIQKSFTTQAVEPLEEISDVEEIREEEEPLPAVTPPTSVKETPPAPVKETPPAPVKETPPAPVEDQSQATVGEVDLESTSLRVSQPAPPAWFEDLSEIEIEIPEKGPEPPPPPPSVPVSVPPPPAPPPPSVAMPVPPPVATPPPSVLVSEPAPPSPTPPPSVPVSVPSPPSSPSFTVSADFDGSGLTFLKFEAPFISPDGQAVLPALFIDAVGNPVRLRIRVTMDGE